MCALSFSLSESKSCGDSQTVHLIRHGESEFNAACMGIGPKERNEIFDARLTQRGRAQVSGTQAVALLVLGAAGTSKCVADAWYGACRHGVYAKNCRPWHVTMLCGWYPHYLAPSRPFFWHVQMRACSTRAFRPTLPLLTCHLKCGIGWRGRSKFT